MMSVLLLATVFQMVQRNPWLMRQDLKCDRMKLFRIEKEELPLVFPFMKFHEMICRRSFTLFTGHLPFSIFVSQFGTPVYDANRLKHCIIMLTAYDFKTKQVYNKVRPIRYFL